jgi:hypothetical protein
VELAAVEKNLASAIELHLQDIVENKLPRAIISEPKINIEYGLMVSKILCNISLSGADILSGWRFELTQLPERSVWRPRVNYNILPEDCLFRPEMALRTGPAPSSYGSGTHFVRDLFHLLFGDFNRR